jgi:hypothetical protein
MGELPFKAVVRASLVLCVFAALATFRFPMHVGPLPAGMHSPVLAFELARSRDEVETMFGPKGSPERTEWARAFDQGNTVDFAMLVAYGSVLALFARALRKRSGARLLRVAEALAFVAPLADALENMRMLAITSLLGDDYTRELTALQWFTWIKWGAIALYFFVLVPSVFALGKFGRALSVLFVLSFSLTFAAWFARGLYAEAMMLALTLSFVGIFVQAVMQLREPRG